MPVLYLALYYFTCNILILMLCLFSTNVLFVIKVENFDLRLLTQHFNFKKLSLLFQMHAYKHRQT